MVLKDSHDTLEEIPETYRELYTEKNGKFECTGISGMKTSADVARVTTALEHEKTNHRATKATLETWGDLVHDDVVKSLDRIEELEAAAGGKLDDAQIDEMATKRAAGIVKTQVAPLERQIKTLQKENGDLLASNGTLTTASHTRSREDMLRPLMTKANILPEYHNDVFLYAEKQLERSDDGNYFARDGLTNITSGAIPKDWLEELAAPRPGWRPGSKGAGARGSGPLGGGGYGGTNYFTHEDWDMTKQGELLKESKLAHGDAEGRKRVDQLAKAAGTTVGGPRPRPKKT